MTLFFKKSSGTQHQKSISQQNINSLIKKTVDGIGSKFDQNIIDQIILSLKTKEGCEYVIKSLIDIIDQCADNDSAIFKALKVFYLCLITNSIQFRSYAQSCLPEIASISFLSFKKPTNVKFRNELHIFSQQIYLNLTLNTPLPSPKQLNLDKYVQSHAFLHIKNKNNKQITEKDKVLKYGDEAHKSVEKSDQDDQDKPDPPVPLSNCQFVENLIEWDIPEEKTTTNNENIINLDDDMLLISGSNPAKDTKQQPIQFIESDPTQLNKAQLNPSSNTDFFQNIPEKKDYFQSPTNQDGSQVPSITQSTPKLLDFIQQSTNDEFIPHKRTREKSYDPPKNDFDLLKDIQIVNKTNTNFNITNNNSNDTNNNFNATANNNSNSTNNNSENKNYEYNQIIQKGNLYELNIDNTDDLNSFIQPSTRSQSFQIFNNVRNNNDKTDHDNKYPFAKQISSDSPSDVVSPQQMEDFNNSKKYEKQQDQSSPNSFQENKYRSFSLDLFPSSSSLPIKTSTPLPAEKNPVKTVRFPTSPNFKDIQNKTSKTNNQEKSINLPNTENKSDLDILGLTNQTNEISKSNTTNDIFDLPSSTSHQNTNLINNNNTKSNFEFYDISSSTTEVNSNDNTDIIDLSSSTINMKDQNKSNNNDDIFDLPNNNSKNDDIFDLSSSSSTLNKNNDISNNKKDDEILDLSSPMNSPKPTKNSNDAINSAKDDEILDLSSPLNSPNLTKTNKNNNDNIDILDLATSPNQNTKQPQNNKNNDIDILDFSNTSDNSSISKSKTNNNNNDNNNNEINIIDLANSASTVDLIPISNIPNIMNSSHIQTSNSADELISLSSSNTHSKTADMLFQHDNNHNNNNFNQISTPSFIPQSPSANIPFIIHKSRNTSNAESTISNLGDIKAFITPSGNHQRSYSNTSPVPVSRITIEPVQRTAVASPSAHNRVRIIDQHQSTCSNENENTSISIIDTTSQDDDENIIPLIETKTTKTQTIAASAPHMLQNQQQVFEVGNSTLIPTSDSPLYSQGKKKKGNKVKSINININMNSDDDDNNSKLIMPSSSFTHSESIRSIFSSESQSSYNSFSSSDQNARQSSFMSPTQQNTMLETIMEEDDTNDQFEPISGRSQDGFVDDNFEPIPIEEEDQEITESNNENQDQKDAVIGDDDDNFEPITIEEEEGNELKSQVEFVPISPRDGEIDDGFEPIDPEMKQFEPIDSDDPIPQQSGSTNSNNLFESIENDNADQSDQFEPISKSENDNNAIYDQFELISTDNIDSNILESISNENAQNGDDDNDEDDSRPTSLDMDGFEPISKEDSIDDDGTQSTDINIENDNFEPISSNETNDTENKDDGFEPISNDIDNDNFEPIDNNNNNRHIDIDLENDNFEPINSATNNTDNRDSLDNFEPITTETSNENKIEFGNFEPIENGTNKTTRHRHNLHSSSNAKFINVSSDGVIVSPKANQISVQPRTKKFNVKKIHSLSNMPIISLDIYDEPQDKPNPSIISETNT